MTDHRITDLSHGHLGEATYDPDEHIWTFTKQTSLENHLLPIRATQTCLAPALRIFDDAKLTPKNFQLQSQWLRKKHPQAISALSIVKEEVSECVIASSKAYNSQNAITSSLLAYGPAANMAARNRPQKILAMVTGEGGDVLRLVKPRVSAFGWESHSGVNLKIAEAEKGEEGYWAGNGGTIHQISFADAIEGPSSWMAVRQPSATTILRPLYCQNAVPASIPHDYPGRYPPSRLQANPLITLPIGRTGNAPHVDVAFNPWYVRQIAVLDQHGHWSIWDIEGFMKTQRNTLELKAYRDGFILDDYIPEPGILLPSSDDGWGRILWCGGVNTLVTCSRRHIAIFDIGPTPRRLYSPDLFKGVAAGWILDVKRSLVDSNNFVVLTSTRIVWLSVDADNGAQIILSSRHFRSQDDDTLKLQLLADQAICVALLYSSRDSLVDTYRFTSSVEEAIAPILSRNSWELKPGPCQATAKTEESGRTNTLCVLPCSFSLHSRKQETGPGQEYFEQGVRFYQIYSLNQGLGLSSTLSASVMLDLNKPHHATQFIIPIPPTIRMVNSIHEKSSRNVIDDSFISRNGTPQSEDDEELIEEFRSIGLGHLGMEKVYENQNYIRTVDAQLLFEVLLQLASPAAATTVTTADYIDTLSQSLVSKYQSRTFKVVNFLELEDFDNVFVEDLDETALSLKGLVESIPQTETEGTSAKWAVTPISAPGINALVENNELVATLDAMRIYDHMVDVWIGSLPDKTPGKARLARERQIRKIATGFYLSRQVFSPVDATGFVVDSQDASLPSTLGDSLETQTTTSSRRYRTPESPPDGSLPTPRPTPSSEDGDLSSRKLREDPCATRLRQYAASVTYYAPMSKKQSRILNHWPSTLGEDPANYVWTPMTISEADNGSRVSRKREKEEARRRKRAERMLAKTGASTVESMSQPMPALPWASQPTFHNVMSSQAIPDEMPMTQTEPGVFGGRSMGQPGKKKKRKVAGFR